MFMVLLIISIVPALAVGWMTHGLMLEHLKSDRMTEVGLVADAKHDLLVRVLSRENARAKSFLESLTEQCAGKSTKIDLLCATKLLKSYLHAEGAQGLSLLGKNGSNLSIGIVPSQQAIERPFQEGQLAMFVGNRPDHNHSYYLLATDEGSDYRLAVSYPSTIIDSIFFPYPEELGATGETFLADGEGYFVTQHKFSSTQGHVKPITAPPMRTCLSGQSGEVLDTDYRDAEIIHGFRFIPEFGSACIMAHITQEEAFAPLRALEKRLMIALLMLGGMLVIATVYLTNRIVRPVSNLTAVVRRIAEGDYLAKAEEAGSSELAELGATFNSMTTKLRESRQLLDSIVEHIPVMVFVKRASDLRIELLNRTWRRLTGYSNQDFLGKCDYDLWSKEQADKFTADDRKVLASHEVMEIPEESLTRANGEAVYLKSWKVALRDEADEPTHLLGISIDITERKRAEESLRIAATAFETHEAIMITDASGSIIRVNQAFQVMTGYSAEEVMGKNPRILSSGRQDKEFYADMWQQLKENGTWSGEIWDKRKSGQIYPKWQTITSVKNDAGKITEYVAVSSDITSRKQAEEEIRTLAFYDSLTGFPNRRLLMDRLRSALSVSARSHLYGAVLFLDMDKFKTLNDTLGHDYGDLLLIEVSVRTQSCVREMDSVARLGGDEFVVLIEELDEHAEVASQKAALIAEKIRAALTAPYHLKGSEYHSSPSIGVSLYLGNTNSADELLKYADMAMYQAKDSGRNAVCFFDPAMQAAVETRSALESDLRRAVADEQLRLYYQIQMDNDHRPIGAEALVRWIHPTRGMVSPAQFIPIAEDSSLILDIGGWVLETACQQLAIWAKNEHTHHLMLAVNVSAKQFKQVDFVETISTLLSEYEVDASLLKLELTESVVLNDVTDVVQKMHALKALGVRLSLDDFGTGYSSLSYLKKLPLDQIKIDQGFVRDIATDPSDAVMVQTIISMAQNFRLNVIAEGVETQAQLDFLKLNGCMAYQGYFFSKPVPIAQFEELLQHD
jgi:diguanylate cyclase (GGDEF)-like protein/PAS domain S-box-containing protein